MIVEAFYINHKSLVAKFSSFLFQAELLIQAHLLRKADTFSSNLQQDYKQVLQLTPRLLEGLIKVFFSVTFSIMQFFISELKFHAIIIHQMARMPTFSTLG